MNKRQFALAVAAHLTGWAIVRAVLDRAVKYVLRNPDQKLEVWEERMAKRIADAVSASEYGGLTLNEGRTDVVADLIYDNLPVNTMLAYTHGPSEKPKGVPDGRERMREACRTAFAKVIEDGRLD